MTLRHPCPACRLVLIAAPQRYCPACARARGVARGSTTARGLGYRYQMKRERVLQRDGYVCWLCGLPGADSVDHVNPRERGGDESDANLRGAHLSCNASRGARSMQARGRKGGVI
jgi:5-methylcytosine-specific restriction endonuclease McrA